MTTSIFAGRATLPPDTRNPSANTSDETYLSSTAGNVSSLDRLITTLEHHEAECRDETVAAREVAVEPMSRRLTIGSTSYALEPDAWGSLAQRCQVPATYLKRCPPDLAAENLNYWLNSLGSRDLLVRFRGDRVRAVLSGGYAPVSHLEAVRTFLDTVPAGKEFDARFELTSSRLAVRFIERDRIDVRPNDPVNSGFHLGNSETGHASLSVSGLLHRVICLNGLILAHGTMTYRRVHRGDVSEIKTQIAEVIRKALDLNGSVVKRFGALGEINVPDMLAAFERIAHRYGLTRDQEDAVKEAYTIERGDTLYHVVNSLTRAGNSKSVALDAREQLQRVGGRIMEGAKKGRWLG